MRPTGADGVVPLFCEELILNVLEGFDLDRVATGIQEEHRALLAGLAFESHVGLDDEGNLRVAQFFCKDVEVEKIENSAEVRYRHTVAVHDIRDGVVCAARILVGEMTDQLVAEEVEIHPLAGAAPFVAAQHVSVEFPRLVEIPNSNRQVKRRKVLHSS